MEDISVMDYQDIHELLGTINTAKKINLKKVAHFIADGQRVTKSMMIMKVVNNLIMEEKSPAN